MPQTPRAPVAGAVHRARPSLTRELAAVASGGGLGASQRHGVSVLSGAVGLDGALATAVANTVGAFALGFLLGRLAGPIRHPLFLPFWVIGVLGSFTTFSTLVSETQGLAARHGGGLGLLHLTLSIMIGLIAFALGQKLARPGA